MNDASPGEGEPQGILQMVRERQSRASALEASAAAVERVMSTSSDGRWQGRAQQSFAAALPPVIADIRRVQQGLEAQSAALQTYAREVDRLKHEAEVVARRLRDEREKMAENRRRLVGVSVLDSGHLDVAFGAPGLSISGDDIRRQGLNGLIDEGNEAIRALEREWTGLVERRRQADRACVAALESPDARGPRSRDLSDTADLSPDALLLLLSRLSPSDLRILLRTDSSVRDRLAEADPSAVREWWNTLGSSDGAAPSAGQLAVIAAFPGLLGALDGIPPLARVAANALNAAARIRAIDRALAQGPGADARALLEKERVYLAKAVAQPPKVQLYLNDQARSRIVEMIGTPSAATTRVITYVPGTYTGLADFYGGGVQAVSEYVIRSLAPGSTVGFVWKDGKFPGEGHGSDALGQVSGLLDANNPFVGYDKGRDLAAFHSGLRTDPVMNGAEHAGIGHSWGLTGITSSEVHGASYSNVVSLSGAGMPLNWHKSSERPIPTCPISISSRLRRARASCSSATTLARPENSTTASTTKGRPETESIS